MGEACEKCKNLKFDEKWGEYKCCYYAKRITTEFEKTECEGLNKPVKRRDR